MCSPRPTKWLSDEALSTCAARLIEPARLLHGGKFASKLLDLRLAQPHVWTRDTPKSEFEYENAQKIGIAPKAMPDLRATFRVAQKMGA